MTHTLARLAVSPEAYAEIRGLIEAAGQSDRIMQSSRSPNGEAVSLHEIAIEPRPQETYHRQCPNCRHRYRCSEYPPKCPNCKETSL